MLNARNDNEEKLIFGGKIEIDLRTGIINNRTVGQSSKIGSKALLLLRYFYINKELDLSVSQILNCVWENEDVQETVVKNQVRLIKQKLEAVKADSLAKNLFTNTPRSNGLSNGKYRFNFKENNGIGPDKIILPLDEPFYFDEKESEELHHASIKANRQWVDKLYSIQKQDILNMSAMPWVGKDGLRYRSIIPSLLMPGKLSLSSSPDINIPYIEFVAKYPLTENILIIGEPGVGKSTLLYYLYIEHSEKDEDILNIYSDSRSFEEYTSENLVNFIIRSNGIQDEPTDEFKYIRVFIDGYDEANADTQKKIINLVREYRHPYVFIISCRERKYEETILSNKYWFSLFGESIYVNKWEPDLSNEYAIKLLTQKKIEHREIEIFIKHFSSNKETAEIYANPFQLNILLYLYYMGEYTIASLNDANLFMLYDRFVHSLYKNEVNRATTSCRYIDFIETSISVAKQIFCETNRQSGKMVKQVGYKFSNLFSGTIDNELREQSIYSSILYLHPDEDVAKFRHETIYEYFLAKSFLLALQNEDLEKVVDEFKNFYDFYINKFVRAGISAYEENSKLYYNTLCSIYHKCIQNIPDLLKAFEEAVDDYSPSKEDSISYNFSENDAITIRELSVYYSSRLKIDFTPKLLYFVWKSDPSLLIRRTAILGLMLHNDEKAEKEYLDELYPGSDSDIMQRSLSVLYFGDASGDILTYRDNGTIAWDNARKEIIERLKFDNDRNFLFRMWDLRTLYLFCESRCTYREISEDDYNIISHCNINSPLYSVQKKKAIKHEKERLLNKIRKNQHELSRFTSGN